MDMPYQVPLTLKLSVENPSQDNRTVSPKELVSSLRISHRDFFIKRKVTS